jgi:hypothetical protein
MKWNEPERKCETRPVPEYSGTHILNATSALLSALKGLVVYWVQKCININIIRLRNLKIKKKCQQTVDDLSQSRTGVGHIMDWTGISWSYIGSYGCGTSNPKKLKVQLLSATGNGGRFDRRSQIHFWQSGLFTTCTCQHRWLIPTVRIFASAQTPWRSSATRRSMHWWTS